MDESQKHAVQGKKAISKGYISFTSIHMTFWKKNYRNRKHTRGLLGPGREVGPPSEGRRGMWGRPGRLCVLMVVTAATTVRIRQNLQNCTLNGVRLTV